MIGLAGIDAGIPDRFNAGITKFFSGEPLNKDLSEEESGFSLISGILKVRSLKTTVRACGGFGRPAGSEAIRVRPATKYPSVIHG